jgi:hypothetical protein
MNRIATVLLVAACGGTSGGTRDSGACSGSACACTPAAQQVDGAALTFTPVGLDSAGLCTSRLLASAADVASAFPMGNAPPEVANADFATDRIVVASSNPAIEFAVDDGSMLVVGEEQLCQGVAPQCTAYIIHGTTRSAFVVAQCPYTGPNPCDVP